MLAFFGLGPQELLIVLLIALLLFGASRLKDIGRSLGEGMREFKRSIRDISEDHSTTPEPPKTESDSQSEK